jgi:hypothetical protein
MKALFMALAATFLASVAIADCASQRPIVNAIALKHGIDPRLAFAIMEVESGCDPKKVGSLGEVGIFQLRPSMHPGAEGTRAEHVDSAIRYLAYVRRHCRTSYGDAWFVCFNTGPFRKTRLKEPTQQTYYKRVQEAYVQNESPQKR